MARRRNSIGVLVSCVLLAVLMWGYVSLTRVYEDYVDVPLTVTAPPNQALLSTVPPTLTFRVRGTGWQILNLRMYPQIACAIDLAKQQPSQQSVYELEKSDLIRAITTSQPFQTLDVVPSTLVLNTGDQVMKRVDVSLRHSTTCRPGFVVIGEPTVEPRSADVRGSEAVVRSIDRWPTQRLLQTDLHYGVTTLVSMSDSLASLLNVTPQQVRVHTNVQQVADRVIVDVPVEIPSIQGARSTMIVPSMISVIVRGGVDDLSTLTAQRLRAVISETTIPMSGYVRPTITVPPNMTLLGTIPSVIRYVERTTDRRSNELSP